MNSIQEKWAKVEEAVAVASELSGDERERWLVEFCGGDSELRAEIDSLLAVEDEAESFLERSADSYAAKILPEHDESHIEGKQFGRYRILREIGRGGMGAVYLAERTDGEFEQQVALKIVRQTIFDSESERRFRRERQILASLNHPNIARLLDGGVSEHGEPFLAMEYIEGEPLGEFIRNRELLLDEKLGLFLKICSAVAYAHRHLVVHRDIKPSNVLVTAEGEPKLLDFGLAKILDDNLLDKDQTATVFRALTPAYASPEQKRGAAVTTVSDIYSLGIVLYELIKNDRFERREAGYLTHKPKTELDAILLTALDEEPERRYKSVEQFAGDIERFLNGQTVSARPNTFGYRAAKFVRRNSLAVSAAVLILVSLVGGIGATLWQSRVAARERDNARAEQQKAARINAFLQGMLKSAAPQEMGKDVKVIEVLADASNRVETDFKDQPESRIEILLTLAQTYGALGQYDIAEQKTRQALDLSLQNFGEVHPATASAKTQLGELVGVSNRYAEAEPLLRESLAAQQRLGRQETGEYAWTSYVLGEILVRKNDLQNAEPLLRDSLGKLSRITGEQSQAVGMALLSLGRARDFSGDADAAINYYRQSVEIFRQSPRYGVNLATALLNLGTILIGKEQYDEARSVLTESAHTAEKAQSDSSFLRGMALNQLSRISFARGDYRATEEQARKSVELLKNNLSPDNPDFLNVKTRLGSTLTKEMKTAEAEPILRETLDVVRKMPLKEPWREPHLTLRLGECLAAQNRFDEAEPLIAAGFEGIKNALGEKHFYTKDAARVAAAFYEKTNRPQIAADYRALAH